MLAAFAGQLETCQALVEGGASVEISDNEGRSALHYAVERENRNVVTFLMKCGADADAKDSKNVSPFSLAKSNGDNGHPCRIPDLCVFGVDVFPLTVTVYVGSL